MFGVEAFGLGEFARNGDGNVGERDTGDAGAVKLKPSCGDADLLGGAGGGGCAQFGMDQPGCLRQEGQEQETGQKLRASEAFAGEKSGHEAGQVFYHDRGCLGETSSRGKRRESCCRNEQQVPHRAFGPIRNDKGWGGLDG